MTDKEKALIFARAILDTWTYQDSDWEVSCSHCHQYMNMLVRGSSNLKSIKDFPHQEGCVVLEAQEFISEVR